jgi:hypothetical protein
VPMLLRSNLNVAALKQADGLAVAPRHDRYGIRCRWVPSRRAGWLPLGLVSWHGPSGERFAIEHRCPPSDVIRQLEATGPSREHPGRAFSEWPTIRPERLRYTTSAVSALYGRLSRTRTARFRWWVFPGH